MLATSVSAGSALRTSAVRMPERGRDIERKKKEGKSVCVFLNFLLFRGQFASYVGQRGIDLADARELETGSDIEKKKKVRERKGV